MKRTPTKGGANMSDASRHALFESIEGSRDLLNLPRTDNLISTLSSDLQHVLDEISPNLKLANAASDEISIFSKVSGDINEVARVTQAEGTYVLKIVDDRILSKLEATQVSTLTEDMIANPKLLPAIGDDLDLVDAWKRLDDELADVGDAIRKNPEALESVEGATQEGLDALDAVEDAIQISGKPKPTWPEIQALFKRGNDFNRKAAKNEWYPFNEVHLSTGKRLDSYNPVTGEIVSRKATDLSTIQKSTFEGYLQELNNKYGDSG